ncbi:MAG: transposase [Solirubrobacterales bacterium]
MRAARKQAASVYKGLGLAPDGDDRPRRDPPWRHSEKEGAAGNFRAASAFTPMARLLRRDIRGGDEMLRAGNAGASTAADQIAVAEAALEQIPAERALEIEILLRVDSAGAVHELLEWAHEGGIRFSVGFDLTEPVREPIARIPDERWAAAQGQDGSARENGEVAEATDLIDLSTWPEAARLIVRRERPHPGAQLSFTDSDGHRFQAILTDQGGDDVAALECRHRARARAEDQIADDKDTGLAKLPFRAFAMNAVWLELVLIANDLLAWTKALLLGRRAGPLAAEAAPPPPPPRCRPARLLRASRQAAPAGGLALGCGAGGGLRKAEGPAGRTGLNLSAPQDLDSLPVPGAPRSLLALGASTLPPRRDRDRAPHLPPTP